MSVVIVGLPRKGDPVEKLSSEKAAHVTLLFLGDNVPEDKLAEVNSWVEHCVTSAFDPMMLEVVERGELGPDKADVLFLAAIDMKRLVDFRSLLLKNDTVFELFSSVPQFPKFTPHLTVGYPETPAHDDAIDYPVSWVDIDRIAVWTGDSEGPEFRPPNFYDRWETEMAMSGLDQKVDEIVLVHYGKKGMKWGVRNVDRGPAKAASSTTTSGKAKITTTGGAGKKASPDALAAAKIKRVKKKSGAAALSNQELQTLAQRMNLEQQVRDLEKRAPKSTQKKGEDFIKQALAGAAIAKTGAKGAKMTPAMILGQQILAAAEKQRQK